MADYLEIPLHGRMEEDPPWPSRWGYQVIFQMEAGKRMPGHWPNAMVAFGLIRISHVDLPSRESSCTCSQRGWRLPTLLGQVVS